MGVPSMNDDKELQELPAFGPWSSPPIKHFPISPCPHPNPPPTLTLPHGGRVRVPPPSSGNALKN